LSSMIAERDNIFNEINQPKLFDGPLNHMDRARFNQAFDEVHNRGVDKNAIVPAHQWSAYGSDMTEYSDQTDYGLLYNDSQTEGGEYFASPFSGGNDYSDLTAEKVKAMKGSEDYSNHAVKDEKFYRSVKDKLSERKKETREFNGRKFNDFKPGEFDQFSVLAQMDPKFAVTDRLELNSQETLEDRFNRSQIDTKPNQPRQNNQSNSSGYARTGKTGTTQTRTR